LPREYMPNSKIGIARPDCTSEQLPSYQANIAGGSSAKRGLDVIIAIGCAAGRIVSTLGLPFAAINTDWRQLENCTASRKLPIGEFGHGAGANPVIGAQAAEEAAETIATLCTEPVLLVAGLGGGTGTGGAPVVARIATA
jgi:cell division GTPase FtsZ